MSTANTMKKGTVGIILFATIWTSITSLFDVHCFRTMWRQFRATRYSATTGHITQSELTHEEDEDGSTTGVNIEYDYAVNGIRYHGDRYRYGAGSSSDCGWAKAAIRQYPVGSAATVYYRPDKPSESLLKPGVEGTDLFLALFLTPFNAVIILLGSVLWSCWRGDSRRPAGGVKISSVGLETKVSLPRFSPIAVGIAVMALMSFVSVFLIAFLGGGSHPSWTLAITTWTIILATAVFVFLWRWARLRSGVDDLVFNRADRTLRLPQTFGRTRTVLVKCDDIATVIAKTIVHKDSDGGPDHHTYAPTLTFRNRETPPAKLAEWSDSDRAYLFANWLNELIATPQKLRAAGHPVEA